jgi:hypothetical protein
MTNQVATYPTDEQLARWKNLADERDMSLSQWVSHMVEAGQKKFEIEVTPDETSSELRDQRNQLRRERDRIGNESPNWNGSCTTTNDRRS